MQLRSQNNSLEFQVQTKDELIGTLRADMQKMKENMTQGNSD
jgi:hypothetical protein